MLAPAGFDASISRWQLNGVWKDLQPLDALAGNFRLIAYDRRESGESGGRIEPLTRETYARHAVGLLDHLDLKDAFLLGGCMGCSVALAVAAHVPQRCRALLLHWPVGGFRWMNKGRSNFDRHIAFARAQTDWQVWSSAPGSRSYSGVTRKPGPGRPMPPQQNAATVREWILQSAGIATTAARAAAP